MANIFTFKKVGEQDAHTLLRNIDEEEANKLVEEGNAQHVDLSSYESLRDRAQQVHREFTEAERKIKNNPDPVMQNRDKQAYELQKVRDEFVSKSKALQDEYETYLSDALEQARAQAVQSTVNVTEKDKATAQQVRDRIALKLATTSKQNIAQVLGDVTSDIALLTVEQKTALAGDIPSVIASIEGEEVAKRALISEVQDTRNQDAWTPKILEQMPHDAAIEYTQTRLLRGWDS